jgi:hypothetical protein
VTRQRFFCVIKIISRIDPAHEEAGEEHRTLKNYSSPMYTRPLTNHYRTPAIFWLTLAVVILSLVASAGGLLLDELYKDNTVIKTTWLANDLITLIFSPLLILAVVLQKRGDERGLLLWMGLMLYMFYNYAFYLFGAKFNSFFLLYVALFSLSLYSIVVGLLTINIHAIHENAGRNKRKGIIGLFLFALAIVLSIVEIKECLTFIFSGRTPEVPTLIFALDLSTVVPTTILAAILLWKNSPWGNVVGMMVLVKAFIYGLVLVTGSVLINTSGAGRLDPFLPFYAALVIGGLLFGSMLFKDLKPTVNH